VPTCRSVRQRLLQLGVLLLAAALPARPQPPQVRHLMNELPMCSVLHEKLEHGDHGDGVDQPYMAAMRQQGVQRALVEVHAVLRGDRPEHIHIVRRLYFRRFDGPDAQIDDRAALDAIQTRGLRHRLDELALSLASQAPVARGPAGPPWVSRDKVYGFVEFFADPWLPAPRPLLFPSGSAETALGNAIQCGDALATQALLRSRKFAKRELNLALFGAVLSTYDNSAVIKLLLNAGADVNARAPDGETPLMVAVGRPCNLQPLLDAGANVNARDKWGGTALQQAHRWNQPAAVRVLEEAGGRLERSAPATPSGH
jgi:hypothetical protein